MQTKRARPYLYTDAEVQKLMAAALDLDSVNGLRHLTYHYLLGSARCNWHADQRSNQSESRGC